MFIKRFKLFLAILAIASVGSLFSFSSDLAFGQALFDPLYLSTVGQQFGGEFDSTGGWTPANWDDMIIFDLDKYYTKGRLFLDVRNFDPAIQSSELRHHILSMYADLIGDHNHLSYNTGDSTEKSVWNLHTGQNYNSGFKFLSIAGDKIETRTNDFNWDLDSTYQLSVFWDKTTVSFFVDSILIVENTHLQNFALRYIFLGRDFTHSVDYNTGFPGNEYPAHLGPIYSNLLVYGDSSLIEIYPNQMVDFPINLPPGSGFIYSFDVDIKYNPNLLRFSSVEKNNQEQDLVVVSNDLEGLLKIGAFSPQPITQYENIVTARFLSLPDSSGVGFAHIKIDKFLVNSDLFPPEQYVYVLHPLDSLQTVPVELSFFQVSIVQNRSVHLQWQTESEDNNYGFEIQRAGNGEPYQNIGFVRGSGTSAIPNYYDYLDQNLKYGSYQYRLKQIDFDGSFSYSEEQMIRFEIPKEFSLLQNYPNPFKKQTTVFYTLPAEGEVNIEIYDIRGRLIDVPFFGFQQSGDYQVTWAGTDRFNNKVSIGIYFIQFSYNGKLRRTLKMNYLP